MSSDDFFERTHNTLSRYVADFRQTLRRAEGDFENRLNPSDMASLYIERACHLDASRKGERSGPAFLMGFFFGAVFFFALLLIRLLFQ